MQICYSISPGKDPYLDQVQYTEAGMTSSSYAGTSYTSAYTSSYAYGQSASGYFDLQLGDPITPAPGALFSSQSSYYEESDAYTAGFPVSTLSGGETIFSRTDYTFSGGCTNSSFTGSNQGYNGAGGQLSGGFTSVASAGKTEVWGGSAFGVGTVFGTSAGGGSGTTTSRYLFSGTGVYSTTTMTATNSYSYTYTNGLGLSFAFIISTYTRTTTANQSCTTLYPYFSYISTSARTTTGTPGTIATTYFKSATVTTTSFSQYTSTKTITGGSGIYLNQYLSYAQPILLTSLPNEVLAPISKSDTVLSPAFNYLGATCLSFFATPQITQNYAGVAGGSIKIAFFDSYTYFTLVTTTIVNIAVPMESFNGVFPQSTNYSYFTVASTTSTDAFPAAGTYSTTYSTTAAYNASTYLGLVQSYSTYSTSILGNQADGANTTFTYQGLKFFTAFDTFIGTQYLDSKSFSRTLYRGFPIPSLPENLYQTAFYEQRFAGFYDAAGNWGRSLNANIATSIGSMNSAILFNFSGKIPVSSSSTYSIGTSSFTLSQTVLSIITIIDSLTTHSVSFSAHGQGFSVISYNGSNYSFQGESTANPVTYRFIAGGGLARPGDRQIVVLDGIGVYTVGDGTSTSSAQLIDARTVLTGGKYVATDIFIAAQSPFYGSVGPYQTAIPLILGREDYNF